MKRLLTGDRPTGRLHLGHYVGSLQNRVALQHSHDTFIMVADVQALTDNFANPQKVRANVYEVVLDNLAVGIDPDKVTYFIQSQIPEIAELTIFFLNLVTVARLQRNPTVKEEIKQKSFGTSIPAGFFCYPVSQAADILTFKAEIVPVGEDQNPMLEQTREIADKFNSLYGALFPRPETVLGQTARLVGIDGNNKMGKSLGNTICLADTAKTTEQMIMDMYTDPNRKKATDPGKVEGNPLFIYLDAFASTNELAQIEDFKIRYREGRVGDVEIKKYLANLLNQLLSPIRMKRVALERQPHLVQELLKKGTARAKVEAQQTLREVKEAMKILY
ncbi:MAG: tryptophan--tRNA ligase [Candidatus Abawacabacteria bacterium]|nr:tryptophan--tRNA ligase [Candidatus Abawacabacteria bacterium]